MSCTQSAVQLWQAMSGCYEIWGVVTTFRIPISFVPSCASKVLADRAISNSMTLLSDTDACSALWSATLCKALIFTVNSSGGKINGNDRVRQVEEEDILLCTMLVSHEQLRPLQSTTSFAVPSQSATHQHVRCSQLYRDRIRSSGTHISSRGHGTAAPTPSRRTTIHSNSWWGTLLTTVADDKIRICTITRS